MSRCDGDTKFPKVYKHARHMLKTLKNPNTGKKLIVDERLNQALKRVDTKFGGFHLKLIACVRNETTELLLTSANFHNWHFHYDHSDMVVYFRLPTDDFRESYLEPLGLVAHQFGSLPLMPRDVSVSSNASESGSINSPSNTSAQAFPSLSNEAPGGSNKGQQQNAQQNGVAGDVSNSSSGTTTPTTTPRSNNTPRSSNRPTPSHTPKVQRVTLVTNESTDTLTNAGQEPTANHVGPDQEEAPQPVVTNETVMQTVPTEAGPPMQITKKTTTYEKGPDSHITKTTTTYETTTTYKTNSLPRNTPSPRPQLEPPPPPPPPPPAVYNESDDSVDIAIQRYQAAPRKPQRQPQQVPSQPHSNTSTLSRQSERSHHEDTPQSYSQQSTLSSRDEMPSRGHSYHGVVYNPEPREYRHDVSRSFNEAQARNVAPMFTEVKTANTKRTTPTQRHQYIVQESHGRHDQHTSLLERASPVSTFYTELQQVKKRPAGPRDQFSHSFEKRMSSLEESGGTYTEADPEPANTSVGVHPIYSEVKRKKHSTPVSSPEVPPPPMPPVHIETRRETTYVKDASSRPDDVIVTSRDDRSGSKSPPPVPETYTVIKARQEEVAPPQSQTQTQSSPPPVPTSPPPAEEPEKKEPYDPQLRYEFSPKDRATIEYTPTFDEYKNYKQGLNETRPFSLPLSVDREERIIPKEKSHQTVVSSPKGPNFSPTFEESPPPPPEPARSPTVDYTEMPIYPEVKPAPRNVTSSPRRVPEAHDTNTEVKTTTSPTQSAPPPSSDQNEGTYQKKPARSLHPQVTTTTTRKEITRSSSGSREATPASGEAGQRESSPPVRMSYSYTEMTPGEAQALYKNMTKPESASGETVPVQEVKTTRHRIEVTRVTHIDTTNVRPYDRPDISNIRFADSDTPPTESHI